MNQALKSIDKLYNSQVTEMYVLLYLIMKQVINLSMYVWDKGY